MSAVAKRRWLGVVLVAVAGPVLAMVCQVPAVAQDENPSILSKELPEAVAGFAYRARLQAAGGVPPLRWTVSEGVLPAGLRLSADGEIGGIASTVGESRFTVTATDNGKPPRSDQRHLLLRVLPPLEMEWSPPPVSEDDTIHGTVKVDNNTPRTLDMTVIVVAVNPIGKAFALGYQHFVMNEKELQEIPFSSSLPRDRYVVHADAVGEDAERSAVYRARLQTEQNLAVE